MTKWKVSSKCVDSKPDSFQGTKFTYQIEDIQTSDLFFVHDIDTQSLPTIVRFNLMIEAIETESLWGSVDVGYYINDTFYYITFKHERFNKDIPVCLDPASIPFLISNKYSVPDSWDQAKVRLRVRIVGRGEVSIALGKLIQTQCLSDYSLKSTIDNYSELYSIDCDEVNSSETKTPPEQHFELLDSYWTKHNDVEQNAVERYFNEGVLCYSKLPPIKIDSAYPPLEVKKYPNYERRWYSLELVHILLSQWRKSRDYRALLSASNAAEKFISTDFYGNPKNIKYIWYDHGTADRMIVLAELYFCLLESGSDSLTLERLFYVIFRHAQALACESFYLRNQKVKYHNHAIFQDRALIVLAEVFPNIDIFKTWKKVAIKRCSSQFQSLISNEGASVENSSGYHIAMKEIVSDMSAFYTRIGLAEQSAILGSLVRKMEVFSSGLHYPDGTIPAFGDTSYKLNSKRGFNRKYEIEPKACQFLDSGYFFLAGTTSKDVSFKLGVISSSKSLIHKHFDNLSFTLWINGTEFIVDPGFFSHGQDEYSVFSKGPFAHNTSIPQGFECDGDWRSAITQSKIDVYRTVCCRQYKVVGSHFCYFGLNFVRTIFIDTEKGYIFVQDIFDGSISLKNSIQLGDSLQVEKSSGNTFDVLSDFGHESLKIIYDESVVAGAIFGQEAPHISGWVYPKVGVKVPAYALNAKTTSNKLEFGVIFDRCSNLTLSDINNYFSGSQWVKFT
ncbi:heparinase II/III domain-containing protein [Vibrio crassostreae]|uniref:heparinase II/III domain-containing protein n=1 Tax=Vibrio crassostreae TaxID=246167 RepID=UPI001B313BA6|nr:heparinase II/III family protein [Vibrio crassostreae]